jgi:hypothetical protein
MYSERVLNNSDARTDLFFAPPPCRVQVVCFVAGAIHSRHSEERLFDRIC